MDRDTLAEVSFGEWLKRRRKALDLTQAQLAQQINCSTSALRKLEAEERRPSEQIARRLAEIFKIPPNEQANFLRFARGDWKSTPPGAEITQPWRIPVSRTNIPASLTSFIGREQQLKDIQAYLSNDEIRLVSLVGPPGIGKTRLSLETGHALLASFPDGVFLSSLASLEDPSLLASTIFHALGYVEASNLPARQQLMDGIGSKRMLIVLDNCEHIIEEVSLLVSEIISGCPQLKILATSRESLRLPGEWVYPVPALAAPDEGLAVETDAVANYPALALFAERARAVRPEFTLNPDNILAVASICAKLDGLPLAIELISTRTRLMSPQALLERLNDQFVLTADGMRSAPTRQKTLEHAIAWSYNLLSEAENELFRSLSVFSGGWTLEAAESVCVVGGIEAGEVMDLLAHLSDKSLVTVVQSKDGQTRYSLLETIRQFTEQRLLESGKSKLVRDRHLEFFLHLAEEADSKLRGPDELFSFERLEREHGNLRSALSWALECQNAEAGLMLSVSLSYFWNVRGYAMERIGWLEKALSQSQGASPSTRASALRWLGTSLIMSEGINPERALLVLEESLALYRELRDMAGIAWVLNMQGLYAYFRGDFKKAAQLYGKSLELRRDLGDPWLIAQTLQNVAFLEFHQGDFASAKNHTGETLALFQRAGDDRGIARTLTELGEIARKEGNSDHAAAIFTEALLTLSKIGDQWSTATVLEHLASVARSKANPERAIRLMGAAESVLERIGLASSAFEGHTHDDNITALRKVVDDATFAKRWAEGKSMTYEQAVDFGLNNPA